jgi:3-oxoacyl-[acyl-carrier protein] reductase
MASLQGKRALVTGGSRGIGAAVVRRLPQEGADVALTFVSAPEHASETVKAAEAHGVKAIAIRADVADASQVVAAVERTVSELGGLDVLVNNAGIAVMGNLASYRIEDFDRTLAVNVRSVFVAVQAAARHMKPGSRIINIGSCNAERAPYAGGSAYAGGFTA